MQNFVGASTLAGNTQNMLTIPKNRRKTLKTEQKQPLEARRSLRSIARDRRNSSEKTEQAGHFKNSNNGTKR
jgi:hypothetical protein